MMIMEGSNMYKTEYDPKPLMYSAYDTPHKLRKWELEYPASGW